MAVAVAKGATAREIAVATKRREATVRELLKRVHVKLGISRRADLVRAVLSVGAFPDNLLIGAVARDQSRTGPTIPRPAAGR